VDARSALTVAPTQINSLGRSLHPIGPQTQEDASKAGPITSRQPKKESPVSLHRFHAHAAWVLAAVLTLAPARTSAAHWDQQEVTQLTGRSACLTMAGSQAITEASSSPSASAR
jgi:hypothetical protein